MVPDIEPEGCDEIAGLDEAALPPARVRFIAPARVHPEGSNADLEGSIFNLSVTGLAVGFAGEARPGERLWVRFRLGLADEPCELLCEVIWRAETQNATTVHGLRFASLTADDAAKIRAAVGERAQGRAAEWALPLLPAAPEARASGPTSNPWVSAAAGMAAGIVLTLAVALIPSQPAQGAPSVHVAPETGGPATQAPPAPAATPVAPAPPATPAPIAVPTAEEPEGSRHENSAPTSARPALLPRRETPAPTTLPRDETLRPLGARDKVELALLMDGPATGHVGFWAESPRRYVVDVPGRKSGFARREYGISHPLATRLRVGQHGSKVRFVIEVAEAVANDVTLRPQGSSLIVAFKRKR